MPSVAETTLGKQIFRMPQDDFTLEFPEPFFYVVKTLGRKFTDQELLAIDAANEDLRIETNADGDFEIMPPPFPETSRKNMAIDAHIAKRCQTDAGCGVDIERPLLCPIRERKVGKVCKDRTGFCH